MAKGRPLNNGYSQLTCQVVPLAGGSEVEIAAQPVTGALHRAARVQPKQGCFDPSALGRRKLHPVPGEPHHAKFQSLSSAEMPCEGTLKYGNWSKDFRAVRAVMDMITSRSAPSRSSR